MKPLLNLLILCLSVFTNLIFGQSNTPQNIHHTILNDKIEIFYDMPVNKDSLRISVLFHKKSDPKFKYTPANKFLKGDFGVGIFSGSNKKISWDWKNEPANLFTGSGFYFEIIASKYSKNKTNELKPKTKVKDINTVPIEIVNSPVSNDCTINIAGQLWMTKNLDVDHYRNGDLIPQVQNMEQWCALKTGAWCYYNNDPANEKAYGKLYNWYAINDPRGLAPEGFHIPDYYEGVRLVEYLGGYVVPNNAGSDFWEKDSVENYVMLNSIDNNKYQKSGFAAQPAGARESSAGLFDGAFNVNDGGTFTFWTTDISYPYLTTPDFNQEGGWSVLFYFNKSKVPDGIICLGIPKNTGISVRCVKTNK
jgi:uncharacterized protein (TIGR02145 family)